MKERLQKILSASGYASRRAAEELIRQGRVRVNGVPAALGMSADMDTDVIELDGVRVGAPAEKTYIMLNKPRGYVTTVSDEKGRKCVTDLVKDLNKRVYPVGRLDMYSEGLLILTDDGDFANRLMHPSGEERKTYHVTVSGACPSEALAKMRSPLVIDGYRIKPAEVAILSQTEKQTVLAVTIHEGRNRQIRKMCEMSGLKLTRLRRVEESVFSLGELPVGKWRHLTETELQEFFTKEG